MQKWQDDDKWAECRPTQSGGGPHQIIPHLKNLRKQKLAKGKNIPVAG